MTILGIIGGIAPESTVDYYRSLIAIHRERTGEYPQLIINSIDLKIILGLAGAGRLDELATYVSDEVRRLAGAGAEIALFASNTPHIVFDQVAQRSPIPLLSIVKAVADEAQSLGVRKAGLFGTRFTMKGGFYDEIFKRRGIAIVIPDENDLEFVHDKYMTELVNGDFRSETHDAFLEIAGRLIDRHQIDALILAGTELPLILREESYRGIPLLNSTQIHVRSAVEALQTSRNGSITNAR